MTLIDWLLGTDLMPGFKCLHRSPWLIGLTISLNLMVAAGYALIALHWHRNVRRSKTTEAKRAMSGLVWIFCLCGLVGYLFRIFLIFVPAWRLYLLAMAVLVLVVARYLYRTRSMAVVFRALDRETRTVDAVKEVIAGAGDTMDPRLRQLLATLNARITKCNLSIDEMPAAPSRSQR